MKLGMRIGAATVDMDRVQIHPTGFLDPNHLEATTKVLCGEMMRGVGGLLLTPNGTRFVNELAPRDKVVAPLTLIPTRTLTPTRTLRLQFKSDGSVNGRGSC